MKTTLLIASAMLILGAPILLGQSILQPWNTIDLGGSVSQGGEVILHTSIGQFAVETSSDNGNILQSGYFPAAGMLAGIPTSVSSMVDDAEYILQQNYPNPFKGETTLQYTISSLGEVTLIVYNTLGKEVFHESHAHQSGGSYSVLWNASTLPAGMYFFRMKVTDQMNRLVFDKNHSMVLLK